MSKEKQIEEMAQDICRLGKPCSKCSAYPDACKAVKYAERFYTAGYRKQSEGEWVRKYGFQVCSNCDATKPIAYSTVLKITYFKCDYCPKCGAKMRKEDEGK